MRRLFAFIAGVLSLSALAALVIAVQPQRSAAYGQHLFREVETRLLLKAPGKGSEGLERAIEAAALVTTPGQPLTEADLASITTLAPGAYLDYGNDGKPLDLDPLRMCPNLATLDLIDVWGVNKRTMRQIGRVGSLEELIITYPHSWCGNCDSGWVRGEVRDLRPLRGLLKLKKLTVAGNKIKSLKPIAGMTQLEYLDVSDNPITDLSPLRNLRKLKFLKIDSTEVTDLTPLADLPALETLECYLSADTVDYSPLLKLPQLKQVNCSTYEVSPAQQAVFEQLTRQGVAGVERSLDFNS